jgi:hypothetical protein
MSSTALKGVAVALSLAMGGPAFAAVPSVGTAGAVAAPPATIPAPAGPTDRSAADRAASGLHLAGGRYYRGRVRPYRKYGHRRYAPRRHFRHRGYGPRRHWRGRRFGYARPYFRHRPRCTVRIVRWTPYGKVVRVIPRPCGYRGHW